MNTAASTYYRAKASQSFESKLRLYLFKLALEDQLEFDLEKFQALQISDETALLTLYTNEYWQYEGDYLLQGVKSIKVVHQAVQELKSQLKAEIASAREAYIDNFESVFPRTQFDDLFAERDKAHCHYCDISSAQIEQLANEKKLNKKNERGWQLELDRKRPNEEYTPDNCVWACYWCNNAKSDEFTAKEFRGVGEAIKEVWRARGIEF
ncbi:MAG: hypothetical protein NXI09_14090 [Bacteroidetes bacterium]|nr:hypothetical protein [Bacteroidota bacterium]